MIEVSFGDHSRGIQAKSHGEKRPIGEIDERCAKAGAVAPQLSPSEEAGHSWTPDAETWAVIKKHSVKRPATVTITGFRDDAATQPVSRGQVSMQTSTDPVGAPIFFRDVPLISPPVGKRGVIMPLPTEAVPLIAWRLHYISELKSRLMMEGLPTCANCHSFSRDGKSLGLDVDGPGNDKGLYGIVPVKKETSIRNEYVIRWSSFAEERASKRFGFMSQISPDGQYVVTSIENPGSHIRNFDYEKSLEIDPKNPLAEGNLAAALIEAGHTRKAVGHINKALELDPEFADAHNLLGLVLARAGQLDEGVAHLEKAAALSPDSLEFQYNLGRLLAAQHSFAEAIPHFEKAVELSDGQEPQSLEMLAAMYSEVQRFRDAARVARQALDLARRENNSTLAETLRARIAYYESQAAKP